MRDSRADTPAMITGSRPAAFGGDLEGTCAGYP